MLRSLSLQSNQMHMVFENRLGRILTDSTGCRTLTMVALKAVHLSAQDDLRVVN